jgi:hypothetical protein
MQTGTGMTLPAVYAAAYPADGSAPGRTSNP